MNKAVPAIVLIVAISVLLGGCRRLGPDPADPGLVASEALAATDEVPRSWGPLVAVTTTAGYSENFAQLWFEEPETGTIRVVYFHFRDRKLDPRVEVIPRSGADSPRAGGSP